MAVPRHPDHQFLAQIYPGGLAASLDEGTWISTGYLVAEIRRHSADRLSRQCLPVFRRYLIAMPCCFVISRCSGGTATNLTQMILYRVGQGLQPAA